MFIQLATSFSDTSESSCLWLPFEVWFTHANNLTTDRSDTDSTSYLKNPLKLKDLLENICVISCYAI